MAKKYRDSLFRDYFNDKVRLLDLCNALLGEDGKNPDEIIINTLDGIFFDEIKNDISCLYRGRFLVIIEHQTSINENMPLRMLFYVAELLRQYVESCKELLYRPKILPLPRPEFFVLYNGKKPEKEFHEMKLSDAFGGNLNFELIVKCYNINSGMNEKFISDSKYLWNYCFFVEQVEKNRAAGMDIKHSVDAAAKYCIEHDIMSKYLSTKKGELASMVGLEYDPELAKKALADYYREEAYKEARKDTIFEMVKDLLSEKVSIPIIMRVSGLSKDEILEIAEKN